MSARCWASAEQGVDCGLGVVVPAPLSRSERSQATSWSSGSVTVSGRSWPQRLGGKRPRGVRGAQPVEDDREVAAPGVRARVRLAGRGADPAHEHRDVVEHEVRRRSPDSWARRSSAPKISNISVWTPRSSGIGLQLADDLRERAVGRQHSRARPQRAGRTPPTGPRARAPHGPPRASSRSGRRPAPPSAPPWWGSGGRRSRRRRRRGWRRRPSAPRGPCSAKTHRGRGQDALAVAPRVGSERARASLVIRSTLGLDNRNGNSVSF